MKIFYLVISVMHFLKHNFNILNKPLPDSPEVFIDIVSLEDLGWGRGKYFFCKVGEGSILKEEVWRGNL